MSEGGKPEDLNPLHRLTPLLLVYWPSTLSEIFITFPQPSHDHKKVVTDKIFKVSSDVINSNFSVFPQLHLLGFVGFI
jgi:hypothetical protein